MLPQKVEEDKKNLSHSLVRNSVIDIDLMKDLEELSQMSSFSENVDESDTERDDMTDMGIKSLKWLLDVQTEEHHFVPIGSDGFYRREDDVLVPTGGAHVG